MADVLRSCAKTGCRWPAAASLSYRYATRQVWLLDLVPTPDPSLYDLCPHHADHLVVPKGWEYVDDRTAPDIMVEPSAFDRAEQAARRRMTAVESPPRHAVAARSPQLVGAAAGRNRYAALAEQLPKLAAEQAHRHHEEPRDATAAESSAPPAESAAAGTGAPPAAESPTAESPAAATSPSPPAEHPSAGREESVQEARPESTTAAATPAGPLADRGRMRPTTGAGRPAPVPTRELAPLACDDVAPPTSDAPAAPPPANSEPLPGQLSIPVDDGIDDSSGVVLQFDLAGSRRRGKSS